MRVGGVGVVLTSGRKVCIDWWLTGLMTSSDYSMNLIPATPLYFPLMFNVTVITSDSVTGGCPYHSPTVMACE